MGRLFVATDTTHKVDYGSPAVLDNLANAGAITVLVVARRNSTNDDLLLASKSDTVLTKGWELHSLDGIDPFTLRGRLRCIIWTDGNYYDIQSTNGDILPLDTHAMVGFTLGGGAVTLYGGPIDTPIPAVAMTTIQAGTGTPREDASSNYYGWNLQRSARCFDGDGSWQIVYDVELTPAQIHTVQQGVLTYRAGIELSDSAMQTRGINIMKSVSGYVLLGYVAEDGTCTDHSGNGNNGTLTGSATGDESENWFAPSDWDDDKESAYSSDLREQTTYRYTSAHARKSFTTTATGGNVWFRRTLDATYDDQGVIGLIVNGIYTDTLVSDGSTGLQKDSFSGLSGSSKTVTVQNGARSAPTGNRPYEGSFVVLVQFNAAATEVASSTRTKAIVHIGDSITQGFLLNPPQEDAPLQQLRLLGYSPTYDGVIDHGAGGLELFDIAGDSTKRAEYATVLTSGNPKRILIQLAANDKLSDRTTANFSTWLDALCDAILAVGGFTGDITLATVTDWGTTQEAATNANGDNIEDFRQVIRDVVISQATSRVALCELGAGLLTPATDLNADEIHLNILGANKLRPRYQDFTADLDYDATVTGTITASVSESDIRSGGKTIVITLGGTRWVA